MPNLTYHDLAPEDFAPMMAMASDWDIVRQLGRWKWPADEDQVRFYCKPFEGDGFIWTIKEDGVFAGRIGVTGGSIGYTLPKSAHGRGIATEASIFALNKAFDLLDLDVITGSTWLDNPASERVLLKLGFQHWQTHFDHSTARGFPVQVRQYRLTRKDWDRLKARAT
jgi:RimJ/RimL family protein N-acetyltransferase